MADQHGTGKDFPSTFVGEFRITGADLLGRLRVLLKPGHARRVTVLNGCGDERLSLPLTLGAVLGTVAGVPTWYPSRKELV